MSDVGSCSSDPKIGSRKVSRTARHTKLILRHVADHLYFRFWPDTFTSAQFTLVYHAPAMLPLSMSHCRSSQTLLRHNINSSRLIYHPLRTYAASPNPRPYNQSKAAPKSPTGLKSASSTKSSPVPLQSVLPVQNPQSRINPPTSSLPPPLYLPTRTLEDGQELEWYKYYYRLGRAYGGFYMAGLKAIWANYMRTREMLKVMPSASATGVRYAVKEGRLSRADFQSIRRSKSDVAKLPPFILLWCICGEFTPLVIVFVTGLVPRTLWIPKQVQKAREKAEERRKVIRREGMPEISTFFNKIVSSPPSPTSREAYRYIAQSLGLYPAWWDRFAPSLVPPGLVKQRVETRLVDLHADDFAIARDGGVQNMSKDEVLMACEERGFSVLSKEDEILRKGLEGWVQDRTTQPPEALVTRRVSEKAIH